MTSNVKSQKISVSKGVLFSSIALSFILGGGLVYFYDKLNSPFGIYDPSKDAKFLTELPLEKAQKMVNYYQENRPTVNSLGERLENPRSIYFDLKTLAFYFAKIKALDLKASGVRVYFGRYKETEIKVVDETKYDFINHSSIIFVATKKLNDSTIVDILSDNKGKSTLFQPFNGGVSCPPLPPRYCTGQKI